MENKRLFNGLHLDSTRFDATWKHAIEWVKNNPNLTIIPDIESGYPEVVTKEYHAAYLKMWEDLKPKPLSKEMQDKMGKIMIFGTAGAIEKNSSFEDIFYNPKKIRRWKQ